MNRDELITALQQSAAQKPRAVFIKGWGQVYIRALTVAEIEEQTDQIDATETVIGPDGKEVVKKKHDKSRLARSAARLLSDENGQRLLDPDNVDDVALLSKQPWSLLRAVLDASELKDQVEGDAEGN